MDSRSRMDLSNRLRSSVVLRRTYINYTILVCCIFALKGQIFITATLVLEHDTDIRIQSTRKKCILTWRSSNSSCYKHYWILECNHSRYCQSRQATSAPSNLNLGLFVVHRAKRTEKENTSTNNNIRIQWQYTNHIRFNASYICSTSHTWLTIFAHCKTLNNKSESLNRRVKKLDADNMRSCFATTNQLILWTINSGLRIRHPRSSLAM